MASTSHRIAAPTGAARVYFALGAKGFRPFFLLASAFAASIIPIWLLALRGAISTGAYFAPAIWHAHEMIFGFAVAVIAGFLLTAVSNWTQRETVTGVRLLGLAVLWVAGRFVVVVASSLPRGVPAIVDLAFLPALLFVLARPLIAAKNRRNFVILAILLVLFATNIAIHFDALGIVAPGFGRRASLAAVDVIILMISMISGRVFPMFTKNATGVDEIRAIPWLDFMTIVGMATIATLEIASPMSVALPIACGLVALPALARTIHWGARHSLGQPLLWILHIGYAWVPIGLLLRAGAAISPSIPSSIATHALTVGAIGSLSLGMMVRVTLGHTGRALVASRPIAWAFGAVTLAAITRALLPVIAPAWYGTLLTVGGMLFSGAFLIFIVVFAPILTRARADGKPE